MADAARRGYDFGYLLKILTNAPLPSVEADFFNTLHLWFPHVYDIKHIMRSVRNLKGGLQEISDSMGVSPAALVGFLKLTSLRADYENRTAASGRLRFTPYGARILPDEEEFL
jgi:hypothetical protein